MHQDSHHTPSDDIDYCRLTIILLVTLYMLQRSGNQCKAQMTKSSVKFGFTVHDSELVG